nr:MAG TPA: Prohead core protein serine protease [Caudoviricetes sp.]
MNRTVINDDLSAVVSEMSDEAVSGLISLDDALVDNVVGDDENPMFITMEVLNEGISRNGRYYDLNALQEVSEQINSEHPDGYAGHISKDERSTKVPDAEVIWLGSKLLNTKGKNRLFAKGYVLPEAKKRRSYLKRAKAVGKNVSVSIYGTAKQVWDKTLSAFRQSGIDIESIDFTRPKSEGVPNGGMGFALTAEMANGNNSNEEVEMNKAEILQSCTKEDLLANVPKDVLADLTKDAVDQASAEAKETISEMTSAKDKVIAELTTENRSYKLHDCLMSRVSDSKARRMVERMVLSEIKDDEDVDDAVKRVLESDEGKLVVSEMTTVEPGVTPRIDQKSAHKAERRFIRRRV